MIDALEQEQAEAVEGALSGQIRCEVCRRWVVHSPAGWRWYSPTCRDKQDCLFTAAQRRAVKKLAREMLSAHYDLDDGVVRSWRTVK